MSTYYFPIYFAVLSNFLIFAVSFNEYILPKTNGKFSELGSHVYLSL